MATVRNVDHTKNEKLIRWLITTFAVFGQKLDDQIIIVMLMDLSEFTEKDIMEALTWCKRYVQRKLYFSDIYKQAKSKGQVAL